MISTSFFELFKIGPGPSSSHTIGPMRAARCFRDEAIAFIGAQNAISSNIGINTDAGIAVNIDVSTSAKQGFYAEKGVYQVRVELYGALAATGHGHGTHRAVLAGLMGYLPTTVDTAQLSNFFEVEGAVYALNWEDSAIFFTENDIFFDYSTNSYRHPNTLRFVLLRHFVPVFDALFYSVGGGFIEREGQNMLEQKPPPLLPHSYGNMAELAALQEALQIPIEQILLENEMAVSGKSEAEVMANIGQIMEVMRQSVVRGLLVEGVLPGGLGVHRRAKSMYEKAHELEQQGRFADALFARMNSYALATSEENAAGQMVVTAPTNGAAGIIPAALAYLRDDCHLPETLLKQGLLIAAMVGFIIKDNASISGAELGCQAEVGSASAMAAALFAFCNYEPFDVIISAAEIAMEHHLGMTCDPIKGLVQVPCIERNANGAIKAYNAYLLASGRSSKPLISFDQVVEVMRQTGLDLSAKYKETATGGLASSFGWGNMPGS